MTKRRMMMTIRKTKPSLTQSMIRTRPIINKSKLLLRRQSKRFQLLPLMPKMRRSTRTTMIRTRKI